MRVVPAAGVASGSRLLLLCGSPPPVLTAGQRRALGFSMWPIPTGVPQVCQLAGHLASPQITWTFFTQMCGGTTISWQSQCSSNKTQVPFHGQGLFPVCLQPLSSPSFPASVALAFFLILKLSRPSASFSQQAPPLLVLSCLAPFGHSGLPLHPFHSISKIRYVKHCLSSQRQLSSQCLTFVSGTEKPSVNNIDQMRQSAW